MAREKHPPCPSCGKALYKAAKAGTKVKKSDPFDFCRNQSCARNLVQEINSDSGPPPSGPKSPPSSKKAPERPPPTKREMLSRKRRKPKKAPPGVVEPEGTFKARQAMRELVKRHMAGKHPDAAALLAVLGLQEAGFHSAASVIIKEHDLSKKFGVKNLHESSTV